MSKKLKLSEAEIEVVKQKIKLAREDAEKQREIRKKNIDAYYRLPLGNEKDGRSKIIDTAVFNHISGLHPHLMRKFLQTDVQIRIKGPDQQIAQALRQRLRDDLHDQGGYTLVDAVLKDGEIAHNGTAKLWWSRVWGKPDKRQVMVTEQELMQLIEDPRFTFTAEDVVPMPIREAEIDDQMGATMHVTGTQMFSVDVTFRDLTESGPVIAPMPPEEFLVERGKAKINDRYGVGHVRKLMAGELQRENERRSTPDEQYYDNLKLAIEAGAPASMTREADERREREDLFWSGAIPLTGDDLRKEVEVVEWCDWVTEVEGGEGELEPAFLIFANGVLIRAEENEDGIIPYCTWSPTPTPHSIIGQSVAGPHVDSQNIRTVITRALLDNVAFTIDRPRFVKNRGVDLLGLQNLTPGKLLHGDPADVSSLDMGELDHRLLQVLEYLKAEGEERGPTTRYNQGTDGGPGGNDTATGISIVQRASFSKIDLIAMAFSELFMVDLYNKLIILYQKNLDLPVIVQVDGEPVKLDRKSIQGRYTAHSDLGADVDFDDRSFQRANALLTISVGMLKQGVYPFSPEAIREQIKDLFVAAGKTDPTKYLEVVDVQPQQVQQQGGPPMAPPGPGGPPGKPGLRSMPGGQPGAPPAVNPVPAAGQGLPVAPGSPIDLPRRPTAGNATVTGGTDDPGAGMGPGV